MFNRICHASMFPVLAIVVTLNAIVGLTPALATQCELAKLIASDGALYDRFGYAVAISGDTIVIGARLDDDNGEDSGSAYVFHFDGANWNQQTKLLASDGATGDDFGCSVAISGDTVVIGARFDDDNGEDSGSAYVFHFDGLSWIQQAKLLPPDGTAHDEFGCSVAISGDAIVIGAMFSNDNGEDSGSAYVFRFDSTDWFQEVKLLPSDGAAGDYFGYSVTISGDTAIIGAIFDDDNGENSGSAYVFHFNGSNWNQQAKLLSSGSEGGEYFGCSVAVSGDAAVIGAIFDDHNDIVTGSAYVFRYSGANWAQEAKLLASDGKMLGYFGYSVAISGDIVVVGAYNSCAAYMFQYNGSNWNQEAKLRASDSMAGDDFGYAVAISGDIALIGADCDDHGSGSAYLFGPQRGDIDYDCNVDVYDFAILALAWLSSPGQTHWNPECDISDPNDNIINMLDLDVLTNNWLAGK